MVKTKEGTTYAKFRNYEEWMGIHCSWSILSNGAYGQYNSKEVDEKQSFRAL